jgi:hypothetical protein
VSRHILIGKISPDTVFCIDAPGGYRTPHFGTDDGLIRMVPVIIGDPVLAVIESADGDDFIYAPVEIGDVGGVGGSDG